MEISILIILTLIVLINKYQVDQKYKNGAKLMILHSYKWYRIMMIIILIHFTN